MKRDERKYRKAVRLADQGLHHAEIARRVGMTHSCVAKWLRPDAAKQYSRKDNARPERREAKLGWQRAARANPAYHKPCPSCGRPTGWMTWDQGEPEMCRACRHERVVERTALIEAWWAEGLTMKEIASRLGWSTKHLSREMDRMRVAGGNLPYRYSAERRKKATAARWGT